MEKILQKSSEKPVIFYKNHFKKACPKASSYQIKSIEGIKNCKRNNLTRKKITFNGFKFTKITKSDFYDKPRF